jgi:hypothetical protein
MWRHRARAATRWQHTNEIPSDPERAHLGCDGERILTSLYFKDRLGAWIFEIQR